MGHIRSMQSCASDARTAVQEFHAGVAGPDSELVLFFCSSNYDLDALAAEMNALFGDLPVVGCTTAGEIGPAGYHAHTLSGVSFPRGACTAVSGRLANLQRFAVAEGRDFAQTLRCELTSRAPQADGHNSFALLLIDGLSIREEPVGRTLQAALRDIALFGGSAGDDLKFVRTRVFHDRAFHEDSAVVVLMSTVFPFRLFKTQHFVSLDERLVVTEADPARRVVREINGLPAAEEYARLIGVDVGELDPARFAASPVVVLIDGADYVRAIREVLPDGSLAFYCAIEEGLVLRVARGAELVANLEQSFERLRAQIGPPQLVLACDCILRNLEMTQGGIKSAVEAVLRNNRAVGFSTYGEQYYGVHVNQTLTGVAIGSVPGEADG